MLQITSVITMYLNIINIRLTAAIFQGLQTFAGPLGQQPIFVWPSGPASGPATDHDRPEVVHNLLWPMATTS